MSVDASVTTDEQPLLIDVDQVADLLTMSTRTVRRLADGGKLPKPRKLGALTRWSRAELEAWVAAGCPPIQK